MPEPTDGGVAAPFVARYSVMKLLGWAALSGTLAGVCLALLSGSFGSAGLLMMAVGALGVMFFGLIATVHVARLFDRREQIIIDQRGVYVRSHGEKRIGLRSIVTMKADMGRLSLFLFKPAKHPIETWHRQLIYRLNGGGARAFFGDVWIWASHLDQPLRAITEAIRAHRPMTEHEQRIAAIVAGWDENGGPYGKPAED